MVSIDNMENGVKRKYEDGPGEVFEGKFGVRDVETKRVRVHRVHKTKEEALLKLGHPNIVKLLHCKSDDDYMYYELGPCLATLDQLFLKSDDARKYNGRMPHHIDGLLQLASGLEYIHSNNIVHGDIKPENVLIAEGPAGQDEVTLKWTNFGLITSVSEARQNSPIGRNEAWLAPELLQLTRPMENVDETLYPESVKSDIFALGLVFGSLLLNGEHLYGSTEKVNEIAGNIVEGNPINMLKMDGKLRDCYENDILPQMLKNDPNERMTSKEVVVRLNSIKEKLTGKENELLELCERDSGKELTGKIKKMIQLGINLNAKDKEGRNALHLLCRNYSNPKLIDAIQILIHSGIDAKAKSNDGSNALHYLCRDNSSPNLTDAISIFTEYGVDLKAKNKAGWDALYYLCNKHEKKMKIWIDRGAPPIGKGTFGTVFKGKFGGREVAVKRVEMRHVEEREEETMLKLDHPNIVKLLHYEKDIDFTYYALELCVASLDQLFLKSDDPKTYKGRMPRQIEVFHQLASGLAYIHSMNLIHRDIRPCNILIMRKSGEDEEIIMKWSEFGLAKSVNEKGYLLWSGVRGTRTWYAPEVLEKLINKEKAENKEFWGNVSSDVFVLGLVFGYLFLKGEHLFGSSETEIHKNIMGKDPVNMKNIDGELRKYYEDDLLTKMLEDNPEKRISSKKVVQQLESIKNKLTEKEEEFRQFCAEDSSPDLLKRINDFICLGIDVNAKNKNGMNALHLLCRYYSNPKLTDAMKLVIESGIDVNARDNDGINAIHYLCRYHSSQNLIDAIQILVEFRIDVNARDKNGMNALHLLCRYYLNPKLTDAIYLVIGNGIDVNARDNNGMNAMHSLCRHHSSQKLIDAIQILIQFGVEAKAKSTDGSNELHYLCRYNSTPYVYDAIDILNKFGVDVTLPDNAGWNAIYYLCNKNNKEMKIFYDRTKQLGEGGFGMVYQGNFGGREVAVKRVLKDRAKEIEEEAMLKLDHPNIVKLLHCETDEDFMYYVLELCAASLDQLFPTTNNEPMPHVIEIFRQLATGLEYIHSKGLIHRDIKPENILIMRKPGKIEEIIMKWSDFGLAKSVNEKGYHSWSGVRGTKTWYAPEVLEKLTNEENVKNNKFWGTVKSDVFVLGLVFGYIFLNGEHLFGSSVKEIHDNIIRNDPVNMKKIDGELRNYYEDDLLTKMLEHDPEKRINSTEVVQQLESIRRKLTEKEEEFRQLCAEDPSPDLVGKE